jgi:hypothetical protein
LNNYISRLYLEVEVVIEGNQDAFVLLAPLELGNYLFSLEVIEEGYRIDVLLVRKGLPSRELPMFREQPCF